MRYTTLLRNVTVGKYLDMANVLIVTAGTDLAHERRRLRKIFGHDIVIKHHRHHIDQIRAIDKNMVWYVPNIMTTAMVHGALDKMAMHEDVASACLASRLFGGYIADIEWLASCEDTFPISGTVPEPMVHMLPGIQAVHELFVHRSIPADAPWALTVLASIDSTINPMSRWVVRLNRLDIKKDAPAIVLFGRDEGMQTDRDVKAKYKARIKVLKRKLKHLSVDAPADHKKKLVKNMKRDTKRAAKKRGVAMTLQMLAHHILKVS
jgi:hypothetical protein